MKKNFILMMFSLFIAGASFGQISLFFSDIEPTPGEVISVPVLVQDFDNVNGFQFAVNYNSSLLTCISITDLNTTLTTVANDWENNITSGQVFISWLNVPSAETSLTDNSQICVINFLANAIGNVTLTFSDYEFFNGSLNQYSVNVTNAEFEIEEVAASTTFIGTGSWFTPGNWDNGIPGTQTDAVINGNVTIDNNAYVDNLTINAGYSATLSNPYTLSVNGNLVLASNASNTRTGVFLNNNTTNANALDVNGTITAQRYFTGGVQHMVSIPVLSASINDFYKPGNTGYMYRYNETTGAWDNPSSTSSLLTAAYGYLVNYTSATTVSVSSVLNNDAKYDAGISYTASNGWNLVGNPYPTSLDWNNGSGWTKTKVDGTIYVWNGSQYASYNGTTGANGGSQYLAPFQGFFIHANASGPKMEIKKAARTINTVGYMKSNTANVLRIALTDGTNSDESVVMINESATASFDTDQDAYKLMSLREDVPSLFTALDEVNYSINALPVKANHSIPVVMGRTVGTSHTFTATGFDSFDATYKFFLVDALTNTTYDLKANNSFNIELSEGLNEGRFTINILKNGVGIEDATLTNGHVYFNNGLIYVENSPNATAYVYDITGALVLSSKLNGSSLNTIRFNGTNGVYLVKVVNGQLVNTNKIVVK
ncbi:MAG: T9SS type A sorting domain-containing protein [Bacteroidales bacterium]|nr:T9SS type A sorting domain-containing protein [Bacteroidales bacterium]MDD3665950.1 T9SS type A sorting domain-containing protein [Bacteroidales bacterium]